MNHDLQVTAYCRANRVPSPYCEYQFAHPRRWRFDFAWPGYRVALEVEGAVWTRGRHTRGSGFLADIEKYNAACMHGWRVLRCTPSTIAEGMDAVVACLRNAA